jgi:hypothetical protein
MTAPGAQQAVAALHAAGDDLEALREAIAAAAFLDATPGDARQKLRGAGGNKLGSHAHSGGGRW